MIEIIKNQLVPFNAKLVAVSKTRSSIEILEAYHSGQRIFGENYVQELVEKQPNLPTDIEWHFIGHLQRNKVKQIVRFIDCIETVDSQRLLDEIDKEAAKVGRVIQCFIQIDIAKEETKHGMSFDEALNVLNWHSNSGKSNTTITGLMGMATNTADEAEIRSEFRKLHEFFNKVSKAYPTIKELSMGMSSDYHIALEEGSTMIRIGSAIFGERIYKK